jgi:hypothetical protein
MFNAAARLYIFQGVLDTRVMYSPNTIDLKKWDWSGDEYFTIASDGTKLSTPSIFMARSGIHNMMNRLIRLGDKNPHYFERQMHEYKKGIWALHHLKQERLRREAESLSAPTHIAA